MKGPLLTAALLAAADQATKAWVVIALPPYLPREVVPGLLDLVYVRNTGVAFSLLAGLGGGWVKPLLIAATLAAMAALLFYLWRLPRKGAAPYAVGLVLGGAAGNLVDRARLGYVIDFIDLHLRGFHWPTFNVADIGISVGVALLIADMVFVKDLPLPGGREG
ncbi:MAG: signal peptidase II [Thermodesulfobacteriota bacterium]